MHLLLYSRGGNIATDFKLVSQVPSEDWEDARKQALQYVRKHESPFVVTPEKILQYRGFDLWRGSNTFEKEIRLLHANANLTAYTEFEIQGKNPAYKMTYMLVAEALEKSGLEIEFIVAALDPADEISNVSAPNLSVRSEALNRALNDAEKLIETNGAVSGLDRAHTLFQAYLQLVCSEANIVFDMNAPITTLFQLIREKHPKMQVTEPHALKQMTDIHRGMARILDAISPLRNQRSLAHPNEVLLGEPEAMLVINCVRALLRYLNSRLRRDA